jgi:catalase
MARTAYTLRPEDDDWGQAGMLVREVMDDAERDRLVSNVVGHLRNGVSEPVLRRTFEYWKNIDKKNGDKIEAAVKSDRPGTRKLTTVPRPTAVAPRGVTEERSPLPA